MVYPGDHPLPSRCPEAIEYRLCGREEGLRLGFPPIHSGGGCTFGSSTATLGLSARVL